MVTGVDLQYLIFLGDIIEIVNIQDEFIVTEQITGR